MSVKKRVYNPPAERIAGNGDPEVEGLFIGAGRGALAVEDLTIRHEYERRVLEIEDAYVKARKKARREATEAMEQANYWLCEEVGNGGYVP